MREVTPSEMWIQEPREGCFAEEWDALASGGFARSCGYMNKEYVGYEFDSTKGYPGEGPPAKQREQPESIVRCMALNTNGMGALERREAATTPEAGETMLVVASAKVSEVLQMMRAGKIQIAILADTSLDEAGTANAIHLFREAGYECRATPGSVNVTRVKRGVIIVWDPTECEVQESDDPQASVVMEERIVKVRLSLIRDSRAVTVYGVYMPL